MEVVTPPRSLPLGHALVLFAASGAVAVGAEAAWFRALRLVFGATAEATGVLLAVYMTGLALGAALGARVADGLANPARAYAACEAVCALFALASGALLERAALPSHALGTPARAAVVFALLAPPTIAMGATLPLLCAAVAPSRARDAGRALAALYAVNLAGGALGSLCAGFALLPRLGVRATLGVLACAGLVVALAALVLGTPRPRAVVRADDPPVHPGSRLALALAAATGVVSFALEVAWTRLFASLLGSAAYTFAALLAVVLASLGAGSAVGRADSALGPRAFYPRVARRLLAVAIGVYTGTLVVYIAPAFLAATARAGHGTLLARAALLLLVVAPPSYQIGALFPALAARFPEARPGRAAGLAQALCTAGNVAGALFAAFVAVPRWGVQTALGVACGAALALACVAAARAGRAALRGMLLAAALGAWAATVLHARWDPVAYSAGAFRVGAYREQRTRGAAHDAACTPQHAFPRTRALYFRDGAQGTVAVLGHDGGPGCSLYSLRVNGKSEGSVLLARPLGDRVPDDAVPLAEGDLPTNTMLGLLPALASEAPPARALLVGWGTGSTACALLDGGTRRLVAFELEPAVLEAAAQVFDARTPRDPRVVIRVDDARTALAREPVASLDVVVSQPSNPWVAGSATLFSREYFALARARLRDGGRMLAWVQLYETDRDAVRSLVATFLAVFPCANAFRVGGHDLLLLGTTGATCPDAPSLAGTLARRLSSSPDAAAALARAGFDGADALGAARVAGPDALARYARGAPVDTDDRAAIEYRIADRVLAGRGQSAADVLRGL